MTVDNLGNAGAEVPIIVKFAKGEVTRRLEVRAKSKATIRVETPAAPQEIVVNDGSVPESDMTNNKFTVEAARDSVTNTSSRHGRHLTITGIDGMSRASSLCCAPW